MHKMLLALLGASLILLALLPNVIHPTLAADAIKRSPGPQTMSAAWQGEVCSNEEAWLKVVAVDKRGVITEIQVEFGENSVSFAHTYCVQGTQPGTPATLLIPHTYPQPGDYTVHVRALSRSSCKSFNQPLRESERVAVPTHVVEGSAPPPPGP